MLSTTLEEVFPPIVPWICLWGSPISICRVWYSSPECDVFQSASRVSLFSGLSGRQQTAFGCSCSYSQGSEDWVKDSGYVIVFLSIGPGEGPVCLYEIVFGSLYTLCFKSRWHISFLFPYHILSVLPLIWLWSSRVVALNRHLYHESIYDLSTAMWNTFFITSCTLCTVTEPAVSFHVLASGHIYSPRHARCHLCQILPVGRGTLIKWHQSVIYYFTQAIMINQAEWRLILSAFLTFIAEELQLKCNHLSDWIQCRLPLLSDVSGAAPLGMNFIQQSEPNYQEKAIILTLQHLSNWCLPQQP